VLPVIGTQKYYRLIHFRTANGWKDSAVVKQTMEWILSGDIDSKKLIVAIRDTVAEIIKYSYCQSNGDMVLLIDQSAKINNYIDTYGEVLSSSKNVP
jgi:hypothetical protein